MYVRPRIAGANASAKHDGKAPAKILRILIAPLSSTENKSSKALKSLTTLKIVRNAIIGKKWDMSHPYSDINGEAVYGTLASIASLNWSFISEVKVSKILAPIYRLFFEILVFVILLSFILFFLLRKILLQLLRPFDVISSGISAVSKGNYLYTIPHFVIKEFELIGSNFNSMLSEINEKQSQLLHKSKLASIGEMAAGVGHEINNPLTISMGNCVLLKKYLSKSNIVDTEIAKRIQIIENGHQRIKNIVDGLRSYSRSDNDQAEVILFRNAIDQTFNLIHEVYEKDGIQIKRSSANSEILMRANMGKLQQIIMNLVSNAKDATKGQKERHIHLKLSNTDSDRFIFSVTDNGTGIPGHVIDKIFEPFFTTKKMGEGTGMGLGIVHEMIKSMNGILNVDTEENVGTTFSINFPSIKESENENIIGNETKIENEMKPENEIKILSGHALVIDDEKEIRNILKEILEELGLNVDTADDGTTGLEKVKNKSYDYICTDMQMLKMCGDEFILKASKLTKEKSKFFVITGAITEKRLEKIKGLVHGVLHKPFDEDTVLKILASKKKNA